MIELTTPELDELIALMDYSMEEGWDSFASNILDHDDTWDERKAAEALNAVRQEVFADWVTRKRKPLLKL